MLHIQKESQASKEKKQALYCHFQGDQSVLQYLNLRVELTIIVDKPFVSSIPLMPIRFDSPQYHKSFFYQPLVGIEAFGENQKEFMLKNKSLLKQNFVYIYFPSNIRVDEKIHKMYLNSYESFIKQIQKPIKSNFTKLIIYDQGVGQHSTEHQSSRCSEILAQLLKAQLQKRVESYIQDISTAVQKQITPEALFTIFKSKLGLAYIYRKIGVNEKAQETLDLLWQDILFNQRYFNAKAPALAIYPPFIQTNYDKIVKKFFNPSAFLQISSFCFLRSYQLDIELMNYCEGVRSLKKFAEVSFNNLVFSSRSTSQNEMLKHLWIISIIDECNQILIKLGRTHPTFLNSNKQAEYNNTAVYIARTYKSSLEYLGSKFYSFNYQSCYPHNMQQQIHYCLENIKAWEKEEGIRLKEVDQVRILNDKCSENLLFIFGGFQCFKYLYLKSIINFYELLARSTTLTRMAKPAKLLLLKVYLSIAPAERLVFSQPYLKQYLHSQGDIQAYLEQIMKKAEKIIIQNEEQDHINLNIIKSSSLYDPNNDRFLNRNRDDEKLWPNLQFIEDYYMFIILLQSYRASQRHQKSKHEESISMSFSKITSKLPLKYDHIMHLLLDQNLMQSKSEWELTLKLARQLFLIQKNQQNQITSNIETPVRLGILLEAEIRNQENNIVVKLNNQQISCLKAQSQNGLIELSMLIVDLYGSEKTVALKCLAIEIQKDNILELSFEISHKECLIFIIKQLRIKIGLILCYYVNKSLELQELHQQQQEIIRKKKKSRKYSSFQERLQEEEFVHMMNKSEQLAMTFLYYHTFQIGNEKVEEVRQRVDSSQRKSNRLSKFSNRSDRDRSLSQSSLYNLIKDKQIYPVVYKNIWSPITLTIKPTYNSPTYSVAIVIKKMIILASETQQISQWIRIGCVWVNRNKTDLFNLTFTQRKGVQIMIMVRNKATKETKNIPKFRKGSQMSQSLFSNASWQKGESLRVQFEVVQQKYSYNVQNTIIYKKANSLDVKYFYSGVLQEYTIVNISNLPLILITPDQSVSLKPFEEYRLEECTVEVQVQLEDRPTNENQFSPFVSKVNLKSHIKKEFLRPQKLQTFQLGLKHQPSFRKMELIYIISSVRGQLSVLDPGQGFQLLGKIEGELKADECGVLDLYLMATTNGKLVLPKLMIDGKRGMWKESIFLNIVD